MKSQHVLAGALLVTLWACRPSGPASGTGHAMDVLETNREAMASLQSAEALFIGQMRIIKSVGGSSGKQYVAARVMAQKPDLLRVESWFTGSAPTDWTAYLRTHVPDTFEVSDGSLWYHRVARLTTREPLKGVDLEAKSIDWRGFFSKAGSTAERLESLRKAGARVEVTSGGQGDVEGVTCDIVKIHTVRTVNRFTDETWSTRWFGAKDHLLRRAQSHAAGSPGEESERDVTVTLLRTNPSFNRSVVFAAPTTPSIVDSKEPVPLAVGTPVPEFSMEDAQGRAVKLSDFRGKLLLLEFWSPSEEEVTSMQLIQDAADKARAKGADAVVLMVAYYDRPAFQKWVAEHGQRFPRLTFAFTDAMGDKDRAEPYLWEVYDYVIGLDGRVKSAFQWNDNAEAQITDALLGASK